MKKQSSLYRHHLMDKHVSGISRIMSWAASLVPSLPLTAPHPLQQHSRSMLPCGNPRSSPAAAPQQPRSSPAAAPQQPLHCSPQRGSRWGRRGNVWWRPSLTIPWRAPRQSRARPHLHLPRARLRRSYDILRTPHGGLCNLHCPQHRTPTPHLHPSPAPLDLTPASTVTRPAAPHTPPGPLAYGAGDGRGTAEEPYMCCTHHVYDAASINLRRDRHISRRARQRLDTSV